MALEMETGAANDTDGTHVWASQDELVRAMIWHEAEFKRLSPEGHDPITLPPACSKIADVLGLLWFERRDGVYLPADHRVVALLRQAAA